MMRSLFAGVSGLRSHQTRMDVIGNNVANVNTLAFKSSRVTFAEGFSQMLSSATRPQGDQGGTNAAQVGLGTKVGSIDTLFSQGSTETTGIATDLAIQGESFFVVSDGAAKYYTRAGNFQLDADGRLVSPTTGAVLQGRMAKDGVFAQGLSDIKIPFGQKTPAKATDRAVLGGNLDASAAVGTTSETSITVYDSQGAKHELKVEFAKTGDNAWTWLVLSPAGATGNGTVNFNDAGALVDLTPATISLDPGNGAATMAITLDPGTGLTALSQYAGRSTAVIREQNGYTMGTLDDFNIDTTGTISGTFTNGVTVVLGQIALADFNNPSGLERRGDSIYAASANSGEAVLGFAGEGSASSITSRALEMSNVDLAQEFTNMIIAQRGFQANSRVISNADEMLQEVVNLKR
jgi:flagellar hook protein FlgE